MQRFALKQDKSLKHYMTKAPITVKVLAT